MPPKIDKSHGFMKSIIQNQVSRDEYHKSIATQQNVETMTPSPTKQRPTASTINRTPKRAAIQLYVPPHVKNKTIDEPREASPSPKNSPEPSKRCSTASENVDKQDQKRKRRIVPSQQDTSSIRVLFKFEFEDDSGTVKTFNVKEDDHAEDLAEIFGNQLGLTKPLKKALQHKLNKEISNCISSAHDDSP